MIFFFNIFIHFRPRIIQFFFKMSEPTISFGDIVHFLQQKREAIVNHIYHSNDEKATLSFSRLFWNWEDPSNSIVKVLRVHHEEYYEAIGVSIYFDKDFGLDHCSAKNQHDVGDRWNMEDEELVQFLMPFLENDASFQEFICPMKEPDSFA